MMGRRFLLGIMWIFFLCGCQADKLDDVPAGPRNPTATIQSITPKPVDVNGLNPLSTGGITHVWANTGEDKIAREDLQASRDPRGVQNSVWDGRTINLFGAKSEVVGFNLILEAPVRTATQVTLQLPFLQGPQGYQITGKKADGEDLFEYVERDIELFFVRYLQIKGISTDLFFSGYSYDERHIPKRCRRPLDGEGGARGGWEDRPCHDLHYPEIAVPIELEEPFNVPSGCNQSIWGDVYISPDSPAGIYRGSIQIHENEELIWEIPVQLEVLDFQLPDLPSAKTMLYISRENINARYLGDALLESDSILAEQAQWIQDRHFQLAHRHKISLISSHIPLEDMEDIWLDRLTGELFIEERGYQGPGSNVGNNVYSIGTYGDWPWVDGGKEAMWEETDRWVNWFEERDLDTKTDYFLYLIDESDQYRKIENWAEWVDQNPGPGSDLLTLATMDLPVAVDKVPSLDIPASWARFGITKIWQDAAEVYSRDSEKRLFLYNSNRPATGSFALEDEGIALRQLAWTQYKMGVQRWFYWEGTYYNNYQCFGEDPKAQTNVFQQAQTYGCFDEWYPSLGETGWNYLNGDGVLFYPGTDLVFPDESYGVTGPFASLRLKTWRRGIQDVDYLTLAADVDADQTAAIVQEMIPEVLWELGVEEMEDPSYLYADISWPTDPDRWEAARRELADIILSSNH